MPIHNIKHTYFSLSYEWAISQKYRWRGNESPSGYGPLGKLISFAGADSGFQEAGKC